MLGNPINLIDPLGLNPLALPYVIPIAETGLAMAGAWAVNTAIPHAKNAWNSAVSWAKGDKKGSSFRGGKKKDRDNWGKYSNNKDFKKWWHRKGKKERGEGDFEGEEIDDIYDGWYSEGKPVPK